MAVPRDPASRAAGSRVASGRCPRDSGHDRLDGSSLAALTRTGRRAAGDPPEGKSLERIVTGETKSPPHRDLRLRETGAVLLGLSQPSQHHREARRSPHPNGQASDRCVDCAHGTFRRQPVCGCRIDDRWLHSGDLGGLDLFDLVDPLQHRRRDRGHLGRRSPVATCRAAVCVFGRAGNGEWSNPGLSLELSQGQRRPDRSGDSPLGRSGPAGFAVAPKPPRNTPSLRCGAVAGNGSTKPSAANLARLCTLALVAAAAGSLSGAGAASGRAPATTEVVVTMKALPLAAFGRSLQAASHDGYRTNLVAAQVELSRRITQTVPGTSVRWRYTHVLAGLAVVVPRTEIGELADVAGVAQVWPNIRYHALRDLGGPQQIGADRLWGANLETAGDGIKIGIIDDGLEATHPYFNPAGYTYPAGFPKGQTTLTTPKVIVQRTFVPAGTSYKYASVPFDPSSRSMRLTSPESQPASRPPRAVRRSPASHPTPISATTRRSPSRPRTSASTATAPRSQRRSTRPSATG